MTFGRTTQLLDSRDEEDSFFGQRRPPRLNYLDDEHEDNYSNDAGENPP